jgi:hypothetical protein
VNSCPEQTGSANKRGTPDEVWLLHSLDSLPKHYTRRGVPLLVCGKVAQRTFEAANLKWNGPVIYMDHPAARNWTKAKLEQTRRKIQRAMPARWRA